jgi:ATP-dependent helicase/nuclease subunit A
MTIHAAKGLEFPFVVVADLAGDATTMFPAVLAGSASAELSISASVRTSGFNEARQERSRLDREERTRLAYVAMTRARDFLVVMLRHSPGKNSPPTLAEQIWSLSSGLSSCASFDVGAAIARRSGRGASHRVEPAGLLDRAESSPSEPGFTPSVIEQWQETRAELLASVLRKRHVAPSSLGHGSAGDLGDGRERSGVELLLEPDDGDPSRWRRGRQASAKGRAVHAVLERMDLRDPENLELLALGASSDEGIAEEAGEVARLARAALGAPTVQAALESSKLMRELPLRVGIGRGTIEGIIDLCYREEDGLVLVDYKTDALASNESLARAGARYHLQIGAYVLALETATRLVVRRAVLIFLAADGGALEYEVPELGRVVELAKLEVVGALEPDLHVHT